MVPARQDFEADHRAVVNRHQWLVMWLDLTRSYRPAQIGVEQGTILDLLVHRALEEAESCAFTALGLVHC